MRDADRSSDGPPQSSQTPCGTHSSSPINSFSDPRSSHLTDGPDDEPAQRTIRRPRLMLADFLSLKRKKRIVINNREEESNHFGKARKTRNPWRWWGGKRTAPVREKSDSFSTEIFLLPFLVIFVSPFLSSFSAAALWLSPAEDPIYETKLSG